MLLIELLILIILLFMFGVLCFWTGFFTALKKKKQKPKDKVAPTPLDLAKRKQKEKEFANFWTYDGSLQTDSNTHV